uniref:hypothetical protein n=1 Tax=Symbiochloris sp. SG-2018 TaxID=2126034 RepID=UPI002113EC73|nr:hypothetical protein NRL16_pgp016 [Symbiochloris sp. SG-2018]UTQ75754.1 hypothetical protein [Symbiochloris sp. SG-2018]
MNSTKMVKTNHWHTINWKKINLYITRLRRKIYLASKEGNSHKVKIHQKLMLSSKANILYSIRFITQKNKARPVAQLQGKKIVLLPVQKWRLYKDILEMDIQQWNPKSQVIGVRPDVTSILEFSRKKIDIPKSNGKRKPLGIPVIKDLILQLMIKNALEPEWEAKFDPKNFGFRPRRSAHDAMVNIWRFLNAGKKTWVLDADIEQCFEKIPHKYLIKQIENFPAKKLIVRWLKAGSLENNTFYQNKMSLQFSGRDIRQDGVLGPLLANIILNGMEETLNIKYHKNGQIRAENNYVVIRYAGDFIVLAKSETLLNEAKQLLEPWLNERNFEFSKEKTKLYNVKNQILTFLGFDFIIQGNICLVRPAKKAVKEAIADLKEIWSSHHGKPAYKAIYKLNQFITEWTNYYSKCNANKTFRYLDHIIWHQALRFGKRTHPNKTVTWVFQKYFRSYKSNNPNCTFDRKYIFSDIDPRFGVLYLKLCASTKIKEHTPIKTHCNADDPEFKEYFKQRSKNQEEERMRNATPFRFKIAKRQKYKCPVCNEFFGDEELEVHHIIPKSQNGSNKPENLIILHKDCHYKIHYDSKDTGLSRMR